MIGNRFARAVLLLLVSTLFCPPASFAKRSVAQKKKIARTQFETAERLREALNGKSQSRRTVRDYSRVIDAFRKVYYTAPTSSKAEEAVTSVAELMADQGRAFDDEKSIKSAVGQYEFLRREYPGSKRRFEALFTIGQLYREDLGDDAKAKQTLEEFLKRYPNNRLADDARQTLAEIADDAKQPKSAKAKKPGKKELARERKRALAEEKVAAPKQRPAEDEGPMPVVPDTAKAQSTADVSGTPVQQVSDRTHGGKLPLVTSIRHWSTPDYTRVAIDLEQEIKYEAGRVPSPDRIFFDLHNTKLAPELVGKTFEVGDGFLRKIRVAQFSAQLTRVVLEVDDVAEYSAFLLPNPYRLIIDVHGKQQAPLLTAQTKQEELHPSGDTSTAARVDLPRTQTSTPAKTVAANSNKGAKTEIASAAAPHKNNDDEDADSADSALKPDSTRELTQPDALSDKSVTQKEVKSTSKPTSAPTFETVSPRKNGKSKKEIASASAREAQPTSSGDRSLIRALGLKIGRIVVDAGHGGHDTGTIGPNGLMEKDLVLDVALRLGKLLEQKLGAEVIYTRDDDTFIPLETRTAIANKHQADLFISVHANSSHDPAARGVETYYLNFTSNAEALEVAARENAVSEKSVFELSDLVKKIALKEKIEESREFAADVQRSLASGLSTRSSAMRDRGVKKAPFVVLIGANMPSILAEISFVSNPGDERRLRTPEHRQKIAESLYRGISRYASGLSGVKVAKNEPAAP